MSNELNIPQEHIENIKHVLSKIEPEKIYNLNLADDKQHQLALGSYQMNGIHEDRYPKTHAIVKAQRENDLLKKAADISPQLDTTMLQSGNTGFGSLAQITNVGTANGGKYASSTAFLSVEGGFKTATLILTITDNSNSKVLVSKKVTLVTSDFITIEATGGTPASSMTAMLQFQYTPNTGSETPLKVTAAVNKNGQADPTITEPVRTPAHIKAGKKNITIALSRGNGIYTDADYWFNKDKYADDTVIVPLVGQVTFSNAIQKPLSDSLELFLTVALDGGGASTLPANMADVKKAFSIAPDGKTLKWNLPANGATPGSKGNPIYYGKAPFGADKITYFFASIGVKTGNNLFHDWAFVQSTDSADEVKDDGIHFIPPLVFVWHCLAEGTLITLADGSTLPIEAIDNTHAVQINQNGDILPVRATTRGQAREGEVFTIKTDQGHQLTLSDGHIMVTTKGLFQVKELVEGDSVITQDGEATIVSIEVQDDYRGKLYNLMLGADDVIEQIPEDATTMFAGGVLVGDHQMQTEYRKKASKRKEYVLSMLPEEWHTDYLSSLEDRA